MDASKRIYKDLGRFLVVTYLLIFPLGQLLRLNLFEKELNSGNLQDVVVLFSLILYFFRNTKKPKVDRYVLYFIFICLFSLAGSLLKHSPKDVLYGSLFLIRLVSYYTFGVMVFNLVKTGAFSGINLIRLLIGVSVVSAIFGWIQYIWLPDLVFLKHLNWDDHLYRLVGTFLDPGMIGVILVLGAILSLNRYMNNKDVRYFIAFLFLVISIFFTYSRASYISLFSGLFVLGCLFKVNLKKLTLSLILTGLLGLFLLPRFAGEGTRLERTQSIFARFSNYSQTLSVIQKYPVFGVGFNNLCAVRSGMFGENLKSHACSGSDSSILFLIATTGIIGFMVFLNILFVGLSGIPKDNNAIVWAVVVAIFVHSLFVQSLFYSFVMGYTAIFFAAAGKVKE